MLDSGKVVVMEFVMPTGCYGCYEAGNYLEDIWDGFGADSSKIEMFAMGYNNAYTCTQMGSWANTYDVKKLHPVVQCASELAYYGSMGMPTIVVVGGLGHNVFYYKEGFLPADTTDIKNAIALALSTASINEGTKGREVSIYPNPAIWTVTVDLGHPATGELELIDPMGEVLLTIPVKGETWKKLDIAAAAPGLYFIRFKGENGIVTRKLIVR